VLIEASPKAFKEVARVELPERSKIPRGSGKNWAHPVISNGKLYLRDYELLFCFDIAGVS
jgi:outer membrane protein assembly factor BamB